MKHYQRKLVVTAVIATFLCNAVSITAPITAGAGGSREVFVSSVDELHNALIDAKPGDKISVEPGTYQNDV